ncbi:MAG: cyclic nucleotide-binding domain-containing protein [Myxococcota bacterium]
MDSLTAGVKALQQMPLLANLPHGELETLAERLKLERYDSGAEIIRQGTSGSSAYFVVSGKCEVRRKTPRGKRRLAFLEPGDFFGELSIVAPAPRSATVTTCEPTVVLVLTEYQFRAALRSNRAMALHLVKVLAERLQRAVDEFTEATR